MSADTPNPLARAWTAWANSSTATGDLALLHIGVARRAANEAKTDLENVVRMIDAREKELVRVAKLETEAAE